MACATHAPRTWDIELSLRLATIPAPSSSRNKLSPIRSRNFHALPLLFVPFVRRGGRKGSMCMVRLGAVVPRKETAMPCVDFKAIKAAVSIEDAANLLKLPLKKSGNKLRGNCPACGKKTTYPRYPTQTLTSLLRWRELLSEADPIGPQ